MRPARAALTLVLQRVTMRATSVTSACASGRASAWPAAPAARARAHGAAPRPWAVRPALVAFSRVRALATSAADEVQATGGEDEQAAASAGDPWDALGIDDRVTVRAGGCIV
jgi:hypothetical protein